MPKTTLNIHGKLLSLDEPVVMGIINQTPDSFFKDSRSSSIKDSLSIASKMLEDGATILDIGGFSTRPGSKEIDEKEELQRVIPVIEELAKVFPEAVLSIDTFRASVAKAAFDAGAGIINDITAGSDAEMFNVVAATKAPYIMMHMRGTATRMMENTVYDNLLHEILLYFQTRIIKLKEIGVVDVIVDPGFGFSKTLDQNYEILKNLSYFEALEHPLLVGVSRKSMIYKLLETSPDEALIGTSVINFDVLTKGARILRVHDVKEAVETIKIYKKIRC